MPGAEFVRRFLLHILPRGLRKIRHYGLYAPANIAGRLAVARTLVGEAIPDQDGDGTSVESEVHELEACPACGEHALRRCHTSAQFVAALLAFRTVRSRGPP